ncbi:lytic transglycosylase domain-containing protein [Pseudoprimorskyibacter insulae]|uniref:Soluble lytic murein transglycosylase n=1 Tax=Pseudoprimorskyibacter insulae TaxID=1695997 RepID=A0A2R8AV67_9RHOB|nr:lytic transglycosylase domain-containing protein [Pseudoprimorskyibacter insulae]SPF79900.1 Soluble lytic murein transglycosylase [Pseudoprimorskyibacter insulae]
MRRLLPVLFLFLATICQAQEDVRPLAKAMQSMREGNWAAAKIEARGDGQHALDVILWHFLRDGQGDVATLMAFLGRNPDWPGLPYLKQKSEALLAEGDTGDVLRFFAGHPPRTGDGALTLARALRASGKQAEADKVLIEAWTTLPMSDSEVALYLADHGKLLAPHHEERLDTALWNGWEVNARAILPLVSDGYRALAEARLALRNMDNGVDGLIAAVPAKLANDPGLAYERFYWRDRKGRDDDAAALMLERSGDVASLGRPEFWAGFRRTEARDLMRRGDYALAYKVAATHQLKEGNDYADLEWVAGYLALRFLDRPKDALTHFEHLRDAVVTPISRGRAGYWMGRAYEAMGDPAGAAKAYAYGADYQTSFYGLLAAEKGRIPFDITLRGDETFPNWQEATFLDSSVFKAAILLLAAGELSLSERFLTHLAESLDRVQIGQMGQMLVDLRQPHIQVMLGKRAADYEIQVPGPYYALHPVAEKRWPVPTELVLSIARRESEFDPNVISGAGARGLMQLMPGTAQEVSGKLGLDYSQGKLLSDPMYNATLGSAYLAELAERYQGNAVLIAAAYNAGPSRPDRWMEDFGDPRTSKVDVVDWIEFIPFTETRNYVMRVTESLPVYRARLGQPPHPVPFSQELTGSTLLPLSP